MTLSETDLQWLTGQLSKVDFLRDLSSGEVSLLARDIEKAEVPLGRPILRQGHRAEAFYLIRAGAVSVWAETPEGSERLAVLAEGESFGEVSILTGKPCNAGVVADKDCVLFTIPPRALREVVRLNPSLAERMSRAVADRRGARALGIDIAPLDRAGMLDRVRDFFKLS